MNPKVQELKEPKSSLVTLHFRRRPGPSGSVINITEYQWRQGVLNDKTRTPNATKQRAGLWNLVRELCGAKGLDPKVKWPQGSTEQYNHMIGVLLMPEGTHFDHCKHCVPALESIASAPCSSEPVVTSAFGCYSLAQMQTLIEEIARACAWLRTGHKVWFCEEVHAMYEDFCSKCVLLPLEKKKDRVDDQWDFLVTELHRCFACNPSQTKSLVRVFKNVYGVKDIVSYLDMKNYQEARNMFDVWYKDEVDPCPYWSVTTFQPSTEPFVTPKVSLKKTLPTYIYDKIKHELSPEVTYASLTTDFESSVSQSSLDSKKTIPYVGPELLNDELEFVPLSPPHHVSRLFNYMSREERNSPHLVTCSMDELDSPSYVASTAQPLMIDPIEEKERVTPVHFQVWEREAQKPKRKIYKKYRFQKKLQAQAEPVLERKDPDPDPDSDALAITTILTEQAEQMDFQDEAPNICAAMGVEPVTDPLADWERIYQFWNHLPEIKLSGGVKEAVPPHMAIRRPQAAATHFGDGFHQWYSRCVQYAEGRKGSGFTEHKYLLRTPAPFPVTPLTSRYAGRIAHYSMQHAIQKQYGGIPHGVQARIQFVYFKPRAGAFRRSKMKQIDWDRLDQEFEDLVQHYLNNSAMGSDADDLDGSGGSLHSIRVLLAQSLPLGGCDSDYHVTNFQDFKVRSMKSKNNNCGIACLLYYTKCNKQQNTIRTEVGLTLNTLLSYEDLNLVSNYLKVGFHMWIMENNVLSTVHSNGLQFEAVADILHNRITNHYALLILVNEKQNCMLCGRTLRKREKHTCNAERVSFFRQQKLNTTEEIASFKYKKGEMRDLNTVYAFDLETFPNEQGIHQPYACKIQNVGSKQEWFRYGHDTPVLKDLFDISAEYTQVTYEDHDPNEQTGFFRYKYHKDKKWKIWKYHECLTRERALELATERLQELNNYPAVKNGEVEYNINDDFDKKVISVMSRTAGLPMNAQFGTLVMEYSYDGSESKAEVERQIQELKDYKDCVFVAHNLSRFDGSFVLNYLMSIGVEPTFVINGGRILSIQWNHASVWDTYLFLTDSLKKVAKAFECKVQKGDFDHELIRSWEDVEKYKEESPKTEKFPEGNGWRPYLDCDVFSLREIIERYSTNVFEQFSVNVFDFVTLSSMSYKLWGLSTLKINCTIETPQMHKYQFIKDGIFGGRVFPMQKEFGTCSLSPEEEKEIQRVYSELEQGKTLDEVKYDPADVMVMYTKVIHDGSYIANMDVNSLYPTAMCKDFPIGASHWSTDPKQDYLAGRLGLYHVSYIAPKHLIMGILPQRNREYCSFDKDKKLNRQWKGSGIKWSLENGEGVYTSVDLKVAESYGYVFEFIGRALVWNESAPVFKSYIEEIYKIKKQQDQYKGTEQYNGIIRNVAKSMMNALFGKTCQRPIQDEQKIIHDEKEFYGFAADYLITDYVWVDINGTNTLVVSGEPFDLENTKPSHLGAFVLAYSRELMISHFAKCTDRLTTCNFSYTDTDSIHMRGKIYQQMKTEYPDMFGSELGQFSNDIDGGKDAVIIYEYCLAPKCYVYVWISSDGKIGMKKKVKGIPYSVMKKLKVSDFKDENSICFNFESLKRNMFNLEKPFSIENTSASRTFLKSKWNKMSYVPELKQFRPFGYDPISTELEVLIEFMDREEKQKDEKLVPKDPYRTEDFNWDEYKDHVIYQTGLEDPWFYKQEPAIHLRKPRLVKWLDQTKPNKPAMHHFSKLTEEDIQECLWRNKKKGALLYEILDGPCRLFCDIDLKRKFDDEREPEKILRDVCTCMSLAATKFGVSLDLEEDLKIVSATTDKKFSFHITSTKHIFQSPAHQKEYWHAVSAVSKDYPDLWNGDDGCVDLPIYHHHRCMRTIYSCKPGGAPLLPISLRLNILPLDQTQISDYLIYVSPNNGQTFSGLSRDPGVGYKKKSGTCHVVKNRSTLPLKTQTLLQSFKHLLDGFDLEFGEESKAYVRLSRKQKGTCSSCKREHEHENGYVKIGPKKSYFVCYRNPTEKIYLE